MENKMTKTQLITLRIAVAVMLISTPTIFILAYLEQYVWGR
jgi:hypothetical protein